MSKQCFQNISIYVIMYYDHVYYIDKVFALTYIALHIALVNIISHYLLLKIDSIQHQSELYSGVKALL